MLTGVIPVSPRVVNGNSLFTQTSDVTAKVEHFSACETMQVHTKPNTELFDCFAWLTILLLSCL